MKMGKAVCSGHTFAKEFMYLAPLPALINVRQGQ